MLEEQHREAVMAPLLPFQRQMVSELLDEDGLCVMSAGLGWQKVCKRLASSSVDQHQEGQYMHLTCCCYTTKRG